MTSVTQRPDSSEGLMMQEYSAVRAGGDEDDEDDGEEEEIWEKWLVVE